MTYRQAFDTEQQAKDFCNSLIHGGIIQQQGSRWHVWQING